MRPLVIVVFARLIVAVHLLPLPVAAQLLDTRLTIASGGIVPDMVSIKMVDDERGWSIIDGRTFLSTIDGGRSWQLAGNRLDTAGYAGTSWGVTSDGELWSLVAHTGQSPSHELLRLKRGENAVALAVPCSGDSGCVADAMVFDAGGRRGLLFGLLPLDSRDEKMVVFRTEDGGRKWVSLDAPDTVVIRGRYTASWIGSAGALLVSGCDFYTTADVGSTWQKSPPSILPSVLCQPDSWPYSIRFIDQATGWLCTYSGWILQTKDAGRSWRISSLGKQTLKLPMLSSEWISFADELQGFVVLNGHILATRDAGDRWQQLPYPEEHFFSTSCAGHACIFRSDARVGGVVFK